MKISQLLVTAATLLCMGLFTAGVQCSIAPSPSALQYGREMLLHLRKRQTAPDSGDTASGTAVADSQKSSSPSPPPSQPSSTAYGEYSDASVKAVAVVLMLTGLLLLLFGRYLFRTVLFIGGFYVFSIVAFSILINVEPIDSATGQPAWGDKRELIYVGICLAGGLIGGVLMMLLWRVGLFFVGALGGFTLAVFVLSWSSNSVIASDVGRNVFIGGLALVCGVLALLFEHTVIIASTAIAGAFAVMMGIDLFAKTGFYNIWTALLKGDASRYQLNNNAIYGMLGAWLFLAVIGMLVQYRLTASKMREESYRKRYSRA